MELNGQLVLGWLEEDNPQRGHFRVRPLLVSTGPLSPEDQAVYRDDGYIRVVPDKNEQRTFKDRMRKTGSLCVMDLRGSAKENGKLRPNKNYAPSKGEKNRYIIYSNAVAAIPSGSFFEVVSDAKVQEGATPQVYARHGGRIHGPVNRENGEDLPGAKPLLPDDAKLFSVTVPGGGTRLFYWPHQETPAEAEPVQQESETDAAEPAEAEMSLALTAAEPKTALDLIRELNGRMVASMKGEEEGQKETPEPVVISQVGTPLYHAVLPPPEDSGANRSLAHAVEKSRRDQKKKDAEPAGAAGEADEVTPAVTDEKTERTGKTEKAEKTGKTGKKDKAERTENPKAAGKNDLADKTEKAEKPAAKSAGKGKTAKKTAEPEEPKAAAEPLQNLALSALQAQVQDLEAERLMAVMNLEKARADQEAFARETLEKAAVSLNEEEQKAQARLEELRHQIAMLEHERDQLEEACRNQASGAPIRFSAETVPAQTVRDQLCRAFRERGLSCDAVRAEAILCAWAMEQSPVLYVDADVPGDRAEAALAFRSAFGVLPEGGWTPAGPAGEALTLAVADSLPKDGAPVHVSGFDRATVLLLDAPAAAEDGFGAVLSFPQSGEEPADELSVFPPVHVQALREEILSKKTELNAETSAFIVQLRRICAEHGETISVACVRRFKRFLMIAQNRMPRGILSALDQGMLLFVLPQIRQAETRAALLPLCKGLAETAERLKKS